MMPDAKGKFTTVDAKLHKKGLSSQGAVKWARIATRAFEDCMNERGDASECEARAIRFANSRSGGRPRRRRRRRLR